MDLDLLTPKVILTIHTLVDLALKKQSEESQSNHSDDNFDATLERFYEKELVNDPATLLALQKFIEEPSYSDLRNLIGFDFKSIKEAYIKYSLWAMSQCNVRIDELKSRSDK